MVFTPSYTQTSATFTVHEIIPASEMNPDSSCLAYDFTVTPATQEGAFKAGLPAKFGGGNNKWSYRTSRGVLDESLGYLRISSALPYTHEVAALHFCTLACPPRAETRRLPLSNGMLLNGCPI